MSYARLFGEWLALFLGAALFVALSVEEDWTQRLDASVLDHVSGLRLTEPSEQIAIVAIDDRSLGELGNWPWDRQRHADLVESLAATGPDLIVYDVLFIEPSNPTSDAALASSIASAGNVVLAHSFGPSPNSDNGLTQVMPLASLKDAAKSVGHVAVEPDQDGIVRRFSLSIDADDAVWSHLALVALSDSLSSAEREDLQDQVPIIPMHQGGAFQTVSAADVIAGRTPGELLAGKIVLVGATAQGLGDRYSVAEHAGRLMPGVEIQANLLSALLQAETIRPMPQGPTKAILIGIMLALFVLLWKLSPNASLRMTVATILGLFFLSITLLVTTGWWLPVSSAVLAIMIAYPVWGWRRLSAVSRFLEAEAQLLTIGLGEREKAGTGFDILARQVSLVGTLVGETRDRLSYLSRVLELSPDPMMIFDAQGRLLMLNRNARELFGSEDANKDTTFVDILLGVNADYDPGNDEVSLSDGRVYLMAQSNAEPEQETQIIALRDVTKARSAEKERAAMLEFLSHDMRSPQVAIVGLAKGNGLDAGTDARFERIEQQARRTLKLTDDFVQIARLEHNGVTLEETDVGALLYEALDRAYTEAGKKKIRLEANIPAEPEFCMIDPLALSRGIDNLIGNALKFSSKGTKVSLTLKRSDRESILIAVEDEGPGLPPERQAEPFARFGANDTKAGPSAGLGLAYVKRVVDEHGGEISVDSKAGEGTRFLIRIPCGKDCGD